MPSSAPKSSDAQVLKRAIQLAERDRDHSDNAAAKEGAVEAAEELGVPAHYVEQVAAAQLERERTQALATRRRALLVGTGLLSVSRGAGAVALAGTSAG